MREKTQGRRAFPKTTEEVLHSSPGRNGLCSEGNRSPTCRVPPSTPPGPAPSSSRGTRAASVQLVPDGGGLSWAPMSGPLETITSDQFSPEARFWGGLQGGSPWRIPAADRTRNTYSGRRSDHPKLHSRNCCERHASEFRHCRHGEKRVRSGGRKLPVVTKGKLGLNRCRGGGRALHRRALRGKNHGPTAQTEEGTVPRLSC